MVSQNFATQSPFTFQQQVLNHPGRRWEIDVRLPPMRRATAAPWLAWLAQLDGTLNTFTAGDPLAATPQGEAAANGTIPVAEPIGESVILVQAVTAATTWLKAGDYFQLGSGESARLHMATQDSTVQSPGSFPLVNTVRFWPPLYSAVAVDDPVTVLNPVGAFRLASGTSQWTEEGAATYSLRFSGVGVV
jgi:hypothetical protein